MSPLRFSPEFVCCFPLEGELDLKGCTQRPSIPPCTQRPAPQ